MKTEQELVYTYVRGDKKPKTERPEKDAAAVVAEALAMQDEESHGVARAEAHAAAKRIKAVLDRWAVKRAERRVRREDERKKLLATVKARVEESVDAPSLVKKLVRA